MTKKLAVFLITVLILLTAAVSVFAENDNIIEYDFGAADVFQSGISNPNPKTYQEGKETPLAPASCEGFEFKGWFFDAAYKNKAESISAQSNGTVRLYAKWYEKSYSISYVLTTPGVPLSAAEITNTNTSTRSLSEQIILTEPYTSSDKYTFSGWYFDSEYTRKAEIISEYTSSDVTLYALWVNSVFSVRYDLGIAALSTYPVENKNPESYTYNIAVSLTDAYTADPAYSFKGWYTDETFSERKTSIPSGTSGDITLYAAWEKTEFTVTYVLTDNSSLKADTITNTNEEIRTADTDFILSSPVTSDKSFAFAGWYTSSDFNDSSKVTMIKAGVIESITLYAKWENAVYGIDYRFGSIDTSQCKIENTNRTAYKFGDRFSLKDVYANGFIFNGWCTDKELKNKITEITPEMYGDITLYADFTEKTYTITYVTEDKDVTASQVVNSNPVLRTTSERVYFDDLQTVNTSYEFGGWYFDSEFKNEATFIKAYTAENVTLYAKWIKIVSYLPSWGDATLSEQLSAADARLILRYSANLETSFSDVQTRISDINNDGSVTAADARIVLRISAAIESLDDIIKEYKLPDIEIEDGEIVFKD